MIDQAIHAGVGFARRENPLSEEEQLSQIREFMLAKYGANGEEIAGLIKETHTPLKMVLLVLAHYHEITKHFIKGESST